jgi:hypothetical protein
MRHRHTKRTNQTEVARHEADRAMSFQLCPSCSYDFATREGTKACQLYACPNLPEILDIVCPTCNYNFFSGEGRPECSDPPICRYAIEEAPDRVTALHRWQEDAVEPAAPA